VDIDFVRLGILVRVPATKTASAGGVDDCVDVGFASGLWRLVFAHHTRNAERDIHGDDYGDIGEFESQHDADGRGPVGSHRKLVKDLDGRFLSRSFVFVAARFVFERRFYRIYRN
jgi:hypothetical protein